MKYMAILIIFMVNMIYLYSEGLNFPELDFGDVPVGIENQPNIRMLPYIITNNSNDVWILEHMILANNYPDSISGNGNTIRFYPGHIFQYVNGPVRIDPHSEFTITIGYISTFIDDISKNGGKLSKSVYFYYRKDGSELIDEDSVKIYARSVPAKAIDSWGAYRNIRSCFTGIGNSKSYESITILNNTDFDITLDSVAINIDGNNLSPLGMSKVYSNDLHIEKTISAKDFSRYFFNFELNSFEISKAYVTFFLSSNANPTEEYILHDSVIFNVVENQQEGFLNLVSRNFVEYVGKTIKSTLFVSECLNTSLFLDSVFVVPAVLNDEFNFKYPSELPISLENSNVQRVTVDFVAKTPGNRYGQICAGFRTLEDEYFSRCIDITISVITPSSINETENINSPFLIYPQPANDALNIKSNSEFMNKIDLIKLYDLYGNLVYQNSSILGDITIPLSNISSGLYFLQIQSSGNIYNYKIPISK